MEASQVAARAFVEEETKRLEGVKTASGSLYNKNSQIAHLLLSIQKLPAFDFDLPLEDSEVPHVGVTAEEALKKILELSEF